MLAALSRRTNNFAASTAVTTGSPVELRIALTLYFPEEWAYLRSPFHACMAIIVTAVTIPLVGVIFRGSEGCDTQY